MVRRSVDFPVPFAPMRPIRAPSGIAQVIPEKIVRSPWARATPARSATIIAPI